MLTTNKDIEAKRSLMNVKEVQVVFSNKELRRNKMRELLKKRIPITRSKMGRKNRRRKFSKGYLTFSNDLVVVEGGMEKLRGTSMHKLRGIKLSGFGLARHLDRLRFPTLRLLTFNHLRKSSTSQIRGQAFLEKTNSAIYCP